MDISDSPTLAAFPAAVAVAVMVVVAVPIPGVCVHCFPSLLVEERSDALSSLSSTIPQQGANARYSQQTHSYSRKRIHLGMFVMTTTAGIRQAVHQDLANSSCESAANSTGLAVVKDLSAMSGSSRCVNRGGTAIGMGIDDGTMLLHPLSALSGYPTSAS